MIADRRVVRQTDAVITSIGQIGKKRKFKDKDRVIIIYEEEDLSIHCLGGMKERMHFLSFIVSQIMPPENV